MLKMVVDQDGFIIKAEGDSEEIYGLKADELVGLPYMLFHKQALEENLSTAWIQTRNGRGVPAHFFARKLEDGNIEVYAQSVLGTELQKAQLLYEKTMFRSLAYAAEYGDPALYDHLYRVSNYTSFFCSEYMQAGFVESERISVAALVHDVGKSAIPREILFKPARLQVEERRFIEAHTEKGYAIIQQIEDYIVEGAEWMLDKAVFQHAKDIALFHHENWNGQGYPRRLSKDEIPIAARVVKVVDVLDALLSSRPYKLAWSWEKVRDELQRLSAVEFDPDIVHWLTQNESRFLEFKDSLDTEAKLNV